MLFASGMAAKMPDDFPEPVALAALDVAGAAPQVARMTTPGAKRADPRLRRQVGPADAARRRGAPAPARIVGVERNEAAAAGARRLGAVDEIVLGDANDAVGVAARAMKAAGGEFDLAV